MKFDKLLQVSEANLLSRYRMVTNASVYAMEVRVKVKTPLISMAEFDLWPRYETKVSLSWRRESRGVQRMELQPKDSSDHSQ